MKETKASELRCPKCFSRWVRTNTTKGTSVCRRCGYIWDSELVMEVVLNERAI